MKRILRVHMKQFDLKGYWTVMQMKSSKLCCDQLGMSQVIANILCKTYIAVVSTGLIKT